jgi:UDP-3-O-[3-hydroxymyristoyl] glucosamine N-acyltransferase
MPKSEAHSERSRTLREIAQFVGGRVEGDAGTRISGACGLREAVACDLTYLSHSKHLPLLDKSQASAAIVGENVQWSKKPVVKASNPSVAFLKALDLWKKEAFAHREISPKAIISKKANLEDNLHIAPGVVIEDDCVIKKGCTILANSFIGRGSVVGEDVLIYQNVTVREECRIDARVILHPGVVIGADGYGYEQVDGRHVKVSQMGNVWIEEDVEIGANSCVDRARFGTTLIKKGTKIDNLVQIAHNVVVGEHCLIVSQAGIAGSAELEDRVVLAGQVGVVGHLKIGANAIIGAQSGVHTSVPKDAILLGSPPIPIRQYKEQVIYMQRLPKLFKEVRDLKKQLEKKIGA